MQLLLLQQLLLNNSAAAAAAADKCDNFCSCCGELKLLLQQLLHSDAAAAAAAADDCSFAAATGRHGETVKVGVAAAAAAAAVMSPAAAAHVPKLNVFLHLHRGSCCSDGCCCCCCRGESLSSCSLNLRDPEAAATAF